MACPLCTAETSRVAARTPRLTVHRCQTCGVHFVDRPAGAASQGGEYYADLSLDAYLAYYGPFRRRVFRHNWRRIQAWRPAGRSLDLGTSFGWFLETAPAGWDARGLEPSPDVAERAKAAGLAVQTGGFETLERDTTRYDLITLWNVLEHLPEPRAVLATIREHLAPGGMLAFCVPNRHGLFNRLAYWAHRASGGRVAGPLHTLFQVGNPAPHLVHYAPSDLQRLLTDAGFTIVASHGQPIVDMNNLKGRAAVEPGSPGLAGSSVGRLVMWVVYQLSRRLRLPDEIALYATVSASWPHSRQ